MTETLETIGEAPDRDIFLELIDDTKNSGTLGEKLLNSGNVLRYMVNFPKFLLEHPEIAFSMRERALICLKSADSYVIDGTLSFEQAAELIQIGNHICEVTQSIADFDCDDDLTDGVDLNREKEMNENTVVEEVKPKEEQVEEADSEEWVKEYGEWIKWKTVVEGKLTEQEMEKEEWEKWEELEREEEKGMREEKGMIEEMEEREEMRVWREKWEKLEREEMNLLEPDIN